MAIEIDKLLEMLKWDQDEKTQKRAIEEGKKVKHMSVFFQTGNKNIWDNCAKIIASHSDEELKIYLRKCLEWLQDANWPGYDVIYNRIKIMPAEMIINEYRKSLEDAQKLEDEMWLIYLSELADEEECKGLYELLTEEEKKIVDEFSDAGLYQDDIYYDVREEYITYLRKGMTNEEATRQIIEENNWCFASEDKGALLWLTLADTQWKYGRLLDEIKEKAIECIDSGVDLKKWKENEKLYKKRKRVLKDLKERLNSNQPPKKEVEQFKRYVCSWEIGDVYAFKVNEEKFMALITIEKEKCYPDNLCPVVYVYNKLFDKVPKLEELRNIKYLPQFFMPEVQEEDEKKSYKTLIYIENETKENIKDYIYVGNNKKYRIPENEDNKQKACMCLIKHFVERQLFSYDKWKKLGS